MSTRHRILAAVGLGTAATLAVSDASVGSRRPSLLAAAPASSRSEATDRCIFSFGVVADIQYADVETASNFAGTEQRNYRGSLGQVERAVSLWNSLSPRPIFVAQLGDLIDGQNAGRYGGGLGMATPQSQPALDRVTGLLAGCACPMYHTIGNHELYNFEWADLKLQLNRPALGWCVPLPACTRSRTCSHGATPATRLSGFGPHCLLHRRLPVDIRPIVSGSSRTTPATATMRRARILAGL
jgi:hypothetical protein